MHFGTEPAGVFFGQSYLSNFWLELAGAFWAGGNWCIFGRGKLKH